MNVGMEGESRSSKLILNATARVPDSNALGFSGDSSAVSQVKVTVPPPDFRRPSVVYLLAKRMLDIFVSALVLLALAPFLLVVAILIKSTSAGPVIYRSRRVGKCGKEFWFYKLRTMYTGAEALNAQLAHQNQHTGPIFKIKCDPRITPVGKVLRKYSIDELPQLLHVLMGDMTLVGPRPHLPTEVVHYDDKAAQRLLITPGLTCYWQIMGRSDLAYEEWIDLDLRYMREMCFWLDIKILLKTPAALLRADGAY